MRSHLAIRRRSGASGDRSGQSGDRRNSRNLKHERYEGAKDTNLVPQSKEDKDQTTGDNPSNEALTRFPTIALSAKWYAYPDRFDWIAAHGFALAYSPNPEAFDQLPTHIDPFLKAGIPVRYHGFFPGYEIGHSDPTLAERAMHLHLSALEAMHGRGDQVITVHVGLQREDPIDHGRVVENLSRLAERGRELDITICLENLRGGPASQPEDVLAWAQASGAMITLDVGHAVSCSRVQSGELSVLDIVEMFADRLFEVHMYEREAERHYPPQDMTILGPIVDRLLTTQCTWWTIELEEYADALFTRSLLLDYIGTEQRR